MVSLWYSINVAFPIFQIFRISSTHLDTRTSRIGNPSAQFPIFVKYPISNLSKYYQYHQEKVKWGKDRWTGDRYPYLIFLEYFLHLKIFLISIFTIRCQVDTKTGGQFSNFQYPEASRSFQTVVKFLTHLWHNFDKTLTQLCHNFETTSKHLLGNFDITKR